VHGTFHSPWNADKNLIFTSLAPNPFLECHYACYEPLGDRTIVQKQILSHKLFISIGRPWAEKYPRHRREDRLHRLARRKSAMSTFNSYFGEEVSSFNSKKLIDNKNLVKEIVKTFL
jgi:hypothetical protein